MRWLLFSSNINSEVLFLLEVREEQKHPFLRGAFCRIPLSIYTYIHIYMKTWASGSWQFLENIGGAYLNFLELFEVWSLLPPTFHGKKKISVTRTPCTQPLNVLFPSVETIKFERDGNSPELACCSGLYWVHIWIFGVGERGWNKVVIWCCNTCYSSEEFKEFENTCFNLYKELNRKFFFFCWKYDF